MRLPICIRTKIQWIFIPINIYLLKERVQFLLSHLQQHIHTQQNNQFVKMASTTASTNDTVYYIEHVLKSARWWFYVYLYMKLKCLIAIISLGLGIFCIFAMLCCVFTFFLLFLAREPKVIHEMLIVCWARFEMLHFLSAAIT